MKTLNKILAKEIGPMYPAWAWFGLNIYLLR